MAHYHADTASCMSLGAAIAEPAQHHGKCREPEVRFRLAATRREEPQVDRLSVGICRIGVARKLQKDERQLKGPLGGALDF